MTKTKLVTMCFEILELRDLTRNIFQAFLAKLSVRKRFYEKSGAKSNSDGRGGVATAARVAAARRANLLQCDGEGGNNIEITLR